ncbi:HpcH/HpaI aldolase family protein [Mesorhizobium xinjiangense]|uniref:HpcH/HpaI aldolase family protein n=1 Tax=Mesorhizobium xinjiangense TaxID=2678685 RepID=UPI0012EEDE03|nr:aldolase/citrate lyase family protein [Mesorhizobium xinjiangense]
MSLRSRLQDGETLFTAWSGVPDTLTVEMVARQGFDAVTLDMQHGGHHEDSVLRSILPVTAAGKHAVVRIPVGRFDMASRALDFGAEAIIAPMVNSVQDARDFAAAMKYPPLGERSWGPTFSLPRSDLTDTQDWLKQSNVRTLSFAMIETRQALDALDGILEVPGIDGVFVGPSDFSIAWTEGAAVDPLLPDMTETLADIGRRTLDAGKVAAIYVIDMGLTGRYAAMGYRFQAIASEHRLVETGAQMLIENARAGLKQA